MTSLVLKRRVAKYSESPLLSFSLEKLANIFSHNQSPNSMIITRSSGKVTVKDKSEYWTNNFNGTLYLLVNRNFGLKVSKNVWIMPSFGKQFISTNSYSVVLSWIILLIWKWISHILGVMYMYLNVKYINYCM